MYGTSEVKVQTQIEIMIVEFFQIYVTIL